MFFIADPGQSYTDIKDLKLLALKCKEAGVTFFKPQLFSTELLYQKDWEYYNFVKSHELSLQDADEIYNYCKEIGIQCMFSCFDISRLRYCQEIGTQYTKVANRMCIDLEFLHSIKEAGMSPYISVSKEKHLPYFTYDDIFGRDKYKLLYVVSKYPAEIEDYSLPMIKLCGGLSNHVLDNGALAIAGTAIGASTIEFHACYNPIHSPDICVSYHTSELETIINKCNKIEKIRGN